jgi:hypothetical protein
VGTAVGPTVGAAVRATVGTAAGRSAVGRAVAGAAVGTAVRAAVAAVAGRSAVGRTVPGGHVVVVHVALLKSVFFAVRRRPGRAPRGVRGRHRRVGGVSAHPAADAASGTRREVISRARPPGGVVSPEDRWQAPRT